MTADEAMRRLESIADKAIYAEQSRLWENGSVPGLDDPFWPQFHSCIIDDAGHKLLSRLCSWAWLTRRGWSVPTADRWKKLFEVMMEMERGRESVGTGQGEASDIVRRPVAARSSEDERSSGGVPPRREHG